MTDKKGLTSASVGVNGDDVTTWQLPKDAIARLGRGRVYDMAFSPDGKYLAVGTSIGLWLYDLPSLSPIALWDTARGKPYGVSFLPDSRRVVIYTSTENLEVWDVYKGACLVQIEKPNKQDIYRLFFYQDGQHIVAVSYDKDKKIYVWCTHTGTKVSEVELQHLFNVKPLCFSPDLSLLAGKDSNPDNVGRNNANSESVVIWQVETGEQIANIKEDPDRVRSFCFSPCGRFLATGNWHGTIHVWEIAKERLEVTYSEYGDAEMYPYYLPDGELIAGVVSDRKVEIWNVKKSEKIDEFAHRGKIGIVCFSDSGIQIALATPSEIKIWTKSNNSDTHTVSTLRGHIPTMDTLVFSEDEKTLTAGFWRDNVLIWDLESRHSYRPENEKLPGSSHNVYRTPNGKIISINQYQNNLYVWEVGQREPIAELVGPKEGLGRAQAYAPAGHRIASADKNDNIHIWERLRTINDVTESENWEKLTTIINDQEYFYGLKFSPSGLAFSPDGKRLASISRSRDWKASLWNVDSGKQITELPLTTKLGPYCDSDTGIAFSPDGNIVAGGMWNEIVLWDATEGKTIMTIPHTEEYQRPITLCFSPCGQYLASGAWWQPYLQKVPIRLWEIATGKSIATFWGHTTDVQCFAFSQDNTLLISGGYDGAIYLWDLKPYL